MKTTFKYLIITLLLIILVKKTDSCTIFYVEKEGVILAGNNEDWSNPASKMFFYPASNGKHGWVKFGWGSGFPQGGMNDQGLFWDGTSGPYLEMPISESGKTNLQIPIMQKVVEECANVEEARKIFANYYCEDQYKAQYLVGDSNGQSVIVEGDNILDKENDYQVLTNFYQSNPELGGYPCWRYNKACEMLGQMSKLDPNFIGSVLAHTHQEGKYPTQYSTIYDLKNGLIYLFHFHNYNEFITINLTEELQNGNRTYNIPDLFSMISNISTSVNKKEGETSVIFSWDGLPDSNYEVIYSFNSDFSNSHKVSFVNLNSASEKRYYGFVYLFVLLPFIKIKRRTVISFICVILFFSLCGTACDKNEDDLPEDLKLLTHTKTVTEFETGKTYYWKIKAKTDNFSNFYSESVSQQFICN
ncbi:MAG: hypothetical protein HN778_08535 [Prolixibacteraceae bacterium]|jgi:hypothetical protein|nr:hypothetical protein [Prolixibacteraceae bacterium]MBT6006982.1 hypothetical protein [Prolixibacteraceae bacterium]MBT6765893.1 hypothetical protein [Prolixibacteraceae bacterium]MBT7000763.1 hypothetical protein [Prolixibacteraceae bacterium]MBT7394861.1 hypothetical protein [Prolixibacteraceae bacterium]